MDALEERCHLGGDAGGVGRGASDGLNVQVSLALSLSLSLSLSQMRTHSHAHASTHTSMNMQVRDIVLQLEAMKPAALAGESMDLSDDGAISLKNTNNKNTNKKCLLGESMDLSEGVLVGNGVMSSVTHRYTPLHPDVPVGNGIMPSSRCVGGYVDRSI